MIECAQSFSVALTDQHGLQIDRSTMKPAQCTFLLGLTWVALPWPARAMPASVDLVDVRLDLRRGARRFDGIGGLSAGASSRALFDYPGISLSIFIFAIIVFVSFI